MIIKFEQKHHFGIISQTEVGDHRLWPMAKQIGRIQTRKNVSTSSQEKFGFGLLTRKFLNPCRADRKPARLEAWSKHA